MNSLILHDVHLWRSVIYTLVFIGMLFEGEIILFTAFYLVAQHQLDPYDTFIVAVVGALIGNLIWYNIGGKIEQFPYVRRVLAKVAPTIDFYIKKNPALTMLVTKFTYGLHHPTLLRIKAAGVSVRRFIGIDIVVTGVWVTLMSSLGYWFAESVKVFRHYLKYSEIGLAIGVILILVSSHFIASYLRAKKDQDS